jgi:hypothetical protein
MMSALFLPDRVWRTTRGVRSEELELPSALSTLSALAELVR